MANQNYQYTPSVNIIRDQNKNLLYIPTPNAKQVYIQIVNSFATGTHSFNIIGSYGTGKSSFLVALENHLNKKKEYFNPVNGSFKGIKDFEYYPIVGDSVSITSFFASEFGVEKEEYNNRDILKRIHKKYTELEAQGKGWIIAIDEFGKFLEYAAKNNPERELYFIQQLAELFNDDTKNILFITTLHQGFNDYALGLSKTQRNEWDKVKGRLKEVTFNEPVEQLLLLASERISSQDNKLDFEESNFSNLFDAIVSSNTFPLSDLLEKTIAKKLLPFDILSAAVLTTALQRYGQNERSLFQFVDSDEYLGLKDFDSGNNPYYNISCVYDYLSHTYYSTINSKHNPDYLHWINIRNALQRAEGNLHQYNFNFSDVSKVIKTIGLLNIFASYAGAIDDKFLRVYANISLGVSNVKEILDKLSTHKIVAYTKHDKRYKFLEGTDLDIDKAISEADINHIADIVPYINKHYTFSYLHAKEHFYNTGCPRYFKFLVSSDIYKESVEDNDGIINLLFNEKLSIDTLKQESKDNPEPVLYCLYTKTKETRNVIIELERVDYVKKHNPNDKVAQRELDRITLHYKKQLSELIFKDLFSNNVVWIFKGDAVKVEGHKDLNQQLSMICEWAYPSTPIFRNEMVNKSKLSGAMQPARRNLIKALVTQSNEYHLGFAADKFPPEKTIYLSLLEATGIHSDERLGMPAERSFIPLWEEGVRFLNDTKVARTSISVFIERLKKKPFGLKQGFIDFWVPIFLYICRDDYALFDENGYVPEVDEETLVLVSRLPHTFEVKAFDISGVKLDLLETYKEFLNLDADGISNEMLVKLIKPFLVFYAQLPDYNKKTKRISKQALLLRDAIAFSKEPETTFFEDFPKAMDISLDEISGDAIKVKSYLDTLRGLVREIRTAYEELLNRIERFIVSEFIGSEIGFEEYKKTFQKRFKNLKVHLLLPNQKIFHQRVMSQLDIRNAWLNSICQAVIGKSLESISDQEEEILYDKFRDLVSQLDNLCDLSKADIDNKNEEVFSVEVGSLISGTRKHMVRIPKTRSQDTTQLKMEVQSKLTKDRNTNIALLLELLEEQING